MANTGNGVDICWASLSQNNKGVKVVLELEEENEIYKATREGVDNDDSVNVVLEGDEEIEKKMEVKPRADGQTVHRNKRV